MTPITKNVIVRDKDGKIIGKTYPKRARGLVKKGRAYFMSDFDNLNKNSSENEIYLAFNPETDKEICPTIEQNLKQSEEFMNNQNKLNKLYFNAREWSFNPLCESNKGERCFITDFNGKLTEVYTIGDWGWNWTCIESKHLILEKNTEHSFVFWLNGGENDQNDEVCQLVVIFNNDEDTKQIYKLNRNYIKTKKCHEGWYFYEITFTTGDNEYTQLKFECMRSHMAIMPAKDFEEYKDLEDTVYENYPQRHNIWFDKGFPEHMLKNHHNVSNNHNNYPKMTFNNQDVGALIDEFKRKTTGIIENVVEEYNDSDSDWNVDYEEFAENTAEQISSILHKKVAELFTPKDNNPVGNGFDVGEMIQNIVLGHMDKKNQNK